jgi:hypothetical protein
MQIRSLAVLLALVLVSVGSAHAKSPVQITPDDNTMLVSKKVGNEQWVLALNFFDQTVTGNVFDLGGKPPAFFFCDVSSADGFSVPADLAGQTLTLDCSSASGCAALPCDPNTEWQALGGGVITLPGSFFLP